MLCKLSLFTVQVIPCKINKQRPPPSDKMKTSQSFYKCLIINTGKTKKLD